MKTYTHRIECPAIGVSKWADVEECGPCNYLNLQDAMSDPDAKV